MYSPIERIKPLPLVELRERYLDRGIPVIIEDYITKWPAKSKWTPEYLSQAFGHKSVPVVTMENSDYANSEVNDMLLSDYLTLIGAINSTESGTHTSKSKSTYLAQVSLEKYFPELVDDLETPEFFPDEELSNVVIYAGGSLFSQLHYHKQGSATLCVIYGKKKVRLFAPDQTPYLYRQPWYSKANNASRTHEKNPDPSLFPKFSKAQYQEVTVSSGEMLFIPIYCWHSIENVDFSIATVFFWSKSLSSRFLPPAGLRSPYLREAYNKWYGNLKRGVKKALRGG